MLTLVAKLGQRGFIHTIVSKNVLKVDSATVSEFWFSNNLGPIMLLLNGDTGLANPQQLCQLVSLCCTTSPTAAEQKPHTTTTHVLQPCNCDGCSVVLYMLGQ